ncbi:MAG: GTPase HflX [Armatimonadota bacterium]|nr:GTPase HflX [Armatimonadota bacterium]
MPQRNTSPSVEPSEPQHPVARLHPVQERERAFLIYVNPDPELDSYVEEELRALCDTAGVDVAGESRQRRTRPDAATFIGKGKAELLFPQVRELNADVVIVDDDLTPLQQRNLEDILQTRVIDRTELILHIFAQRAHTREGKLQVELARLTYELPRLMSVYTKFEQQAGHIGVRGGPGETKLEQDRRKVRERIADLQRELEQVARQRSQQRQGRRRLPFPFGALVGYTSAGKSTLLNTLSGAHIYTDEHLFATLDPTVRRIVLPDGWGVLLSDTVGFIRNLPHSLVAAFRATLEEVTEADFLIHVVDASHPQLDIQRQAVMNVLAELGVHNKPIITAYNKADLVRDTYRLRQLVAETPNAVYISALKAEGISELMHHILTTLQSLLQSVKVRLPYAQSNLLAQCYELGRVRSAEYTADGILVEADVTHDLAELLKPYRVDT